MKFNLIKKNKLPDVVEKESGIALLVAILTVGIALTIGMSALDTSLKQIEIASLGKESTQALFAANVIFDCVLYWEKKDGTTIFAENNNTTTSPPPSGTKNCVGKNIIDTNPLGSKWDVIADTNSAITTFKLKNFGTNGDLCADAQVSKLVGGFPSLRIEARGRNSCDNTPNKRRVERGISLDF